MALIDEISIIIRNERPEHLTAQLIISRVKSALWEQIENHRNDRVELKRLCGGVTVRLGDAEDLFTYLLGDRKPQ